MMEDEVLKEIWDNWKPYHESGNVRSYVADASLDTDQECIHLVKTHDGQIYQLETV